MLEMIQIVKEILGYAIGGLVSFLIFMLSIKLCAALYFWIESFIGDNQYPDGLTYSLEPTMTGWRAAAILDGKEVLTVQEGDFDRAAAWCRNNYKQSELQRNG